MLRRSFVGVQNLEFDRSGYIFRLGSFLFGGFEEKGLISSDFVSGCVGDVVADSPTHHAFFNLLQNLLRVETWASVLFEFFGGRVLFAYLQGEAVVVVLHVGLSRRRDPRRRRQGARADGDVVVVKDWIFTVSVCVFGLFEMGF